MFTENWDQESVLKEIQAHAKSLDFTCLYQAVCYFKECGYIVIFNSHNENSYDTTFINEIEYNHSENEAKIYINFTNLFGYLPTLYDFLSERLIHKNNKSFLNFLNIFYNRIFYLFLDNKKFDSQFFTQKLNLKMISGLSSLSTTNDAQIMPYHAFFQSKFKSKRNFEKLLSQFTNMEVRIQEFVGHFIPFEAEYQMHLDKKGVLDGSFSLGRKYWCENSKIKIIFFPKSENNFEHFYVSKKNKNLVYLINRYLNKNLDYEMVVFPNKKNQNKLLKSAPAKLGLNTFLCLNESNNENTFFKLNKR